MEKRIESLAALAEEARDFVSRITPRTEGATLVTLSGELGAGKTAFTKEVAKMLGVDEVITSPTFVLEKVYPVRPVDHGAGAQFKRLIHIDAYRLESGESLAPLGFEERMQDPGNLVLLEWPERVADSLPPAHVAITFTVLPNDARTITYAD